MQLMPGTAKEMGVTDSFDPTQNVMGGSKYIAKQLQAFGGDLELALGGYNWGPENIAKRLRKGMTRDQIIAAFPAETKGYVARIKQLMEREGRIAGTAENMRQSTALNIPVAGPALQGAGQAFADLRGVVEGITDWAGITDARTNRSAEDALITSEAFGRAQPGMFPQTVSGVTRSLTSMAPAIGVGLVNPAAGMALAVGTPAATTYSSTKQATGNTYHAIRQGLIEGGITGAFSAIGLGGLEKAASKGFRVGLKALGIDALSELGEEEAIQVLQNVERWYTNNFDPNKKMTAKEVMEGTQQVAIQTIATLGVVRGSQGIASSVMGRPVGTEKPGTVPPPPPAAPVDPNQPATPREFVSQMPRPQDLRLPVQPELIPTTGMEAGAPTPMAPAPTPTLNFVPAPQGPLSQKLLSELTSAAANAPNMADAPDVYAAQTYAIHEAVANARGLTLEESLAKYPQEWQTTKLEDFRKVQAAKAKKGAPLTKAEAKKEGVSGSNEEVRKVLDAVEVLEAIAPTAAPEQPARQMRPPQTFTGQPTPGQQMVRRPQGGATPKDYAAQDKALNDEIEAALDNQDLEGASRLYSKRKAITQERLLESNNGNLVGIEASNGDGTRWAVLVPEMSGRQGQFRLQIFDKRGLSGHQTYNSAEEALREMADQGYRNPDKGAMDRLAQTREFQDGNESLKAAQDSWKMPATPAEPSGTPGQLPQNDLKSAWTRYADTGESTVWDLANDVEGLLADGRAPESLQAALDDFRAAQQDDSQLYGDRSGETARYGDLLADAVQKVTGEDAPAPAVPASGQASSIDVSPISRANSLDELTAIAGRLAASAKTNQELAAIQAAIKKRKAELPTEQEVIDEISASPQIFTTNAGGFIHKSARSPGKIQMTRFTETGVPAGHEEYDSWAEALDQNEFQDDPFPKRGVNFGAILVAKKKAVEIHGDDNVGPYVYYSPLRPFSFGSPISKIEGVVTGVTSDNTQGVVFSKNPLPLDTIERNELQPFDKQARLDAYDQWLKRSNPEPTPTPGAIPEPQGAAPQSPTSMSPYKVVDDPNSYSGRSLVKMDGDKVVGRKQIPSEVLDVTESHSREVKPNGLSIQDNAIVRLTQMDEAKRKTRIANIKKAQFAKGRPAWSNPDGDVVFGSNSYNNAQNKTYWEPLNEKARADKVKLDRQSGATPKRTDTPKDVQGKDIYIYARDVSGNVRPVAGPFYTQNEAETVAQQTRGRMDAEFDTSRLEGFSYRAVEPGTKVDVLYPDIKAQEPSPFTTQPTPSKTPGQPNTSQTGADTPRPDPAFDRLTKKQPWDMTREEFVQFERDRGDPANRIYSAIRYKDGRVVISKKASHDELINRFDSSGEYDSRNDLQDDYRGFSWEGKKDDAYTVYMQDMEDNDANIHKALIAKAMSRGDSVPPAVLAEYPDLAEKYGEKATPAARLAEKKANKEKKAKKLPEPLKRPASLYETVEVKDDNLAAYRDNVRANGVRPPKVYEGTRLNDTDFGGKMLFPWWRTDGSLSWDEAMEMAYEQGLITSDERTEPSKFRELMTGPVTKQVPVAPKFDPSYSELALNLIRTYGNEDRALQIAENQLRVALEQQAELSKADRPKMDDDIAKIEKVIKEFKDSRNRQQTLFDMPTKKGGGKPVEPVWDDDDLPFRRKTMREEGIGDDTSVLFQDSGNAPVWYSKLRDVVDEKMGGAMDAAQLRKMLEGAGVKPEEMEWSRIGDLEGRVTKQQVLSHLAENAIQVEEVTGSEQEGNLPNSHLRDMITRQQLPGGENYRELLLKLPAKTPDTASWDEMTPAYLANQKAQAQREFKSSHFSEPNILAHVRFNDRTDADGKRVLFLEEVQSDWHQEGRKKGYGYPDGKVVSQDGGLWKVEWSDGTFSGGYHSQSAAQDQIVKRQQLKGVPDAPFKTTWPDLTMKRMVRWAAENGYDRIAWTTGDMQADRYDLSKQVQFIGWGPSQKYERSVTISPIGGDLINFEVKDGKVFNPNGPATSFAGKPLDEVVGKEMAEKILSESGGSLSGDGLKIGGTGMKAFYDRMLPIVANRIGKKHGARVGTTKLDTIPGGAREMGDVLDRTENPDFKMSTVHSFDITPSMREEAMTKGMALFQGNQSTNDPKGAITFEGNKAVIHIFESADISTFAHESGHYFRRNFLEGDALATAAKWSKVKPDGVWTKANEERFARGWERYLRDGGKFSHAGMQGVFDKFKGWLTNIYRQIKGSPIDINLSPEMVKVFDDLLGVKRQKGSANVQQEGQGRQAQVPQQAAGVVPSTPMGEGMPPQERPLAPEPASGAQQAVPNRANPGMEPDVRDLFDLMEQMRNETGKPEVKTDIETAEQAASLDGAAVRAKTASGEMLNDAETVRAAEILNIEGKAAIESGNFEAIVSAGELFDGWRTGGTEMGRAFRQRHDKVEGPAQRLRRLTQAIFTPSQSTKAALDLLFQEEKKAINAADKAKKKAERQKILRREAKKTAAMIKKWQEAGFNINEQTLKDPDKMAWAVKQNSIAKSDVWDMANELRMNAMLGMSAPPNIAGNLANLAQEFGIQRPAEALLNIFSNNPDATSFQELAALYSGIRPGLKRALRNGIQSFRTELPAFEYQVGGPNQYGSVDSIQGPAIGGILGRVVRMGFNPVPGLGGTTGLQVQDEFFKSVAADMEVRGAAIRIGKAQGLKGKELNAFVAQQAADYTSKSWERAIAKAEELTFQTKLGKSGQQLMAARDSGTLVGRVLQQLFPFIRTPVNILKTGVRKSPLGSVGIAYQVGKKAIGQNPNYDSKRFQRDAAEQVLAWTMLAALDAWREDDEGNPVITGGIPRNIGNTAERDVKQGATPAYSIKIGDTWYSYARIEPIATTLGTTIDMLDAVHAAKDGQPKEAALRDFYLKFKDQISNKSFLRGLGDIMDAFDDPIGWPRWGSNFLTSYVPSTMRRSTQSADDKVRELRANPQSEIAIAQNVPGKQSLLQPKVNVWGEEITKDEGKHATTDWLYRMMIPADTRDLSERNPQALQLDRMLLNWNNTYPDKPYWPETPQTYYTKDGETIDWTDAQYNQLSILAGQKALEVLGRRKDIDYDNPTEGNIKTVKEVLEKARGIAKRAVLADVD
jgi:hypothetical protein